MILLAHLAYQGTNYRGWQRQSNVRSVQEILEDTMSKVIGEKIFLHGCGRTDAGVHALQYFTHFDIITVPDYDLCERVNQNLPNDVTIYKIWEVATNFNAQKNAINRTYTYYIHTRRIPSLSHLSAYYNLDGVDFEIINEAMEFLKSTTDFYTLAKKPDIYPQTNCNITALDLVQIDDFRYKFTVSANRFLRAMVRNIVARLIDVGMGRILLDDFKRIIARKEKFSPPFEYQAFAQGLYLSKVEYPDVSLDTINLT